MPDFEANHALRSDFIRELSIQQLAKDQTLQHADSRRQGEPIPRALVRYWHDPAAVPADVQACLDSWEDLAREGILLKLFDDSSAQEYIASYYGHRETLAFQRCRHPAMRSDYFRMCYVLHDGGAYIDADDVLIGDGWRQLFEGDSIKLQPLCFDVAANRMTPAAEIRRIDLSADRKIFYVNNNPLAAPRNHPLLRRALSRATCHLLGSDPMPEIQATTGPGNLTVSLAHHAVERARVSLAPDYTFLLNWDLVSEPRWDLGYRDDERNWRNMDQP